MTKARRLPEDVTIEIVELAPDGLGRGWHEEREVRLRGTLPGETATGAIRKRSRGMWLGDAVAVQSASPDRIAAPCSVFRRCGGCTFQHLLSKAELSLKTREVETLLAQQGLRAQRWQTAVASPLFGYRRKARLGVRQVGQQVYVGFREPFSGRVVDMTACPVLHPPFDELIDPLRRLVGGLSIASRIPQVEVAAGDSSAAVVLRHLDPLAPGDLSALDAFARRSGIGVWLQPGGPESVEHYAGPDALLDYANPDFGLIFQFGPLDFVQVNAHINRQLVRAAVRAVADCGEVLDLFCGLGNFSLALARAGHVVTGIEAGEAAVDRARDNAALNGLSKRSSFRAVDLYGPAGAVLPEAEVAEALLLDPPRSGAGPNLRGWLSASVRKVVYVSCNPVTFATDAVILKEAGFQLRDVGIFDMFPRTTHVETFGVFTREVGGNV